ncbi:hypothetical protein [Roseomonas rosulenta]|uniref:hypothetical protein n=1 Tax=Roseomonas rosulenta TaxID=2748667 RepID=UPI0018DF6491|nr:hypothetical protein [Roseomonas rosulenta]
MSARPFAEQLADLVRVAEATEALREEAYRLRWDRERVAAEEAAHEAGKCRGEYETHLMEREPQTREEATALLALCAFRLGCAADKTGRVYFAPGEEDDFAKIWLPRVVETLFRVLTFLENDNDSDDVKRLINAMFPSGWNV